MRTTHGESLTDEFKDEIDKDLERYSERRARVIAEARRLRNAKPAAATLETKTQLKDSIVERLAASARLAASNRRAEAGDDATPQRAADDPEFERLLAEEEAIEELLRAAPSEGASDGDV